MWEFLVDLWTWRDRHGVRGRAYLALLVVVLVYVGVILGWALRASAQTAPPLVGADCQLVFTPSPDLDVVGYAVFVGTAPGSYGPPLTVPVSDLDAATPPNPSTDRQWPLCRRMGITTVGRYYATLEAVDAVGNRSVKAVEAPFDADPIAPRTPTALRVQSGP